MHFVRSWGRALLAGAATAIVFIPWDIYFTRQAIWGFNARHVLGPHLFGLPVEEWAFFFVMPFACIFISESLKAHSLAFKVFRSKALAPIAALVLVVIGLANPEKTYTLWAFVAAAGVFAVMAMLDEQKRSQSLTAYTFCLIPFYIANGVLTGAVTAQPVVWYDNAFNLGLRLGTIPVEDHFYMFAHLVPSFLIFDRLSSRSVLKKVG